jgi:hypothetical protein
MGLLLIDDFSAMAFAYWHHQSPPFPLLFTFSWGFYIILHTVYVISSTIAVTKKGFGLLRVAVLFGTQKRFGPYAIWLIFIRLVAPIVIYLVLWLPMILQWFPETMVDGEQLVQRSWIVYGVYLAYLIVILPCTACFFCFCKFVEREQVTPDEELESAASD